MLLIYINYVQILIQDVFLTYINKQTFTYRGPILINRHYTLIKYLPLLYANSIRLLTKYEGPLLLPQKGESLVLEISLHVNIGGGDGSTLTTSPSIPPITTLVL